MKRYRGFIYLICMTLLSILLISCNRKQTQACISRDFNEKERTIQIHKEFHKKMLAEQNKGLVK